MYKKYLYSIPLFLLEVIIQLAFFWLAPMCECRWIVYSFLTGMTLVHLVITFVLMVRYGVRKNAATIVGGSFVETLIIGAAVYLLMIRSNSRSALFMMLVLMALYAAVVTILCISIEGFGEQYEYKADIEPDEFDHGYNPYNDRERIDYTGGTSQPENIPPVRAKNVNNHPANDLSGRRTPRRTPPPIPVKR